MVPLATYDLYPWIIEKSMRPCYAVYIKRATIHHILSQPVEVSCQIRSCQLAISTNIAAHIAVIVLNTT